MDTPIKELTTIILGVKSALAAKESEIKQGASVSTYTRNQLENRKLEVALFENSAKYVTTDPTQKETIIANYTKDAEKIIAEINKVII